MPRGESRRVVRGGRTRGRTRPGAAGAKLAMARTSVRRPAPVKGLFANEARSAAAKPNEAGWHRGKAFFLVPGDLETIENAGDVLFSRRATP